MQQTINHLIEFSLESTNPILKNHASFSFYNISTDDTANTGTLKEGITEL